MVKIRLGQRISDDTTVQQLRGISQKMGHRLFDMSTSCLAAVDDEPAKVTVPKVEKPPEPDEEEPKEIKKSKKK